MGIRKSVATAPTDAPEVAPTATPAVPAQRAQLAFATEETPPARAGRVTVTEFDDGVAHAVANPGKVVKWFITDTSLATDRSIRRVAKRLAPGLRTNVSIGNRTGDTPPSADAVALRFWVTEKKASPAAE